MDDALIAGANALEPDVMRFSDKAYYAGTKLNSQAGQSGLFMYHDDVLVTTRMPDTVEGYLDHVHALIKSGSNIALIVFDIKPPAAASYNLGNALRTAVNTHLNTDGVYIPVIYSVASISDYEKGGVFNGFIGQLQPNEGVMIDSDNDPVKIFRTLSSGISGGCGQPCASNYNIGYGNGSIGTSGGSAPNVLTSIDKVFVVSRVHWLQICYSLCISNPRGDINARVYYSGVDGLIPDRDLPAVAWGDTLDQIRILSGIVSARSDIYLATAADDPFSPPNAAYALLVPTPKIGGAGTDSMLTFTLRGNLGEASVTIDASYAKRMESGDYNYVTIQSKNLGTLQCLTLQSDGSGAGSAWKPGIIFISSARWGIPYPDKLPDSIGITGDFKMANFTGTTVDKGSPQAKSWGDLAPDATCAGRVTTRGQNVYEQ